jgi:hypothetical protein
VLRERELHPDSAAAVQAEAVAHQKAQKKGKKPAAKKAVAVKKEAAVAKAAPKVAKAPAAKKASPKTAPTHKPVRTPRPASKG